MLRPALLLLLPVLAFLARSRSWIAEKDGEKFLLKGYTDWGSQVDGRVVFFCLLNI